MLFANTEPHCILLGLLRKLPGHVLPNCRPDRHLPLPVSVWWACQHCVGLAAGVNSKFPFGSGAGRDLQRLPHGVSCPASVHCGSAVLHTGQLAVPTLQSPLQPGTSSNRRCISTCQCSCCAHLSGLQLHNTQHTVKGRQHPTEVVCFFCCLRAVWLFGCCLSAV